MSEPHLPHDHSDGAMLRLQESVETAGSFQTVADIFKLLSDSSRVRIFWLLCHCEECVIDLSAMVGMSSPAVSHHLRQLRESGLLVSRRVGKEVYYRAADTEQIRLLHEMIEQVMKITCPDKAVDYSASQEEIVRNVHRYLTEHLSERITIEELSRKFLMNATTLKNVFKQVYGTTIAAHMRMHRLEQAALLLQTTKDDIASIAQAVGYDSASRFTTAFREMYGETPTGFRRSRQK